MFSGCRLKTKIGDVLLRNAEIGHFEGDMQGLAEGLTLQRKLVCRILKPVMNMNGSERKNMGKLLMNAGQKMQQHGGIKST